MNYFMPSQAPMWQKESMARAWSHRGGAICLLLLAASPPEPPAAPPAGVVLRGAAELSFGELPSGPGTVDAFAALRPVLAALPEARLVGGAVRDWLAGLDMHDIDLATPRQPEAVDGFAHLGEQSLGEVVGHGVTIPTLAGPWRREA